MKHNTARPQKIPVFISSQSAYNNIETPTEEEFHTVFCKIYVYDYFQNAKCLFKGLGKILLTPQMQNASGEYGNLFDFNEAAESEERERQADAECEPCIRQVNSVYGDRLKKRFSSNPLYDVDEQSRIISGSLDALDDNLFNSGGSIESVNDDVLTIGSEDSPDWNVQNAMTVEDRADDSRDVFDEFMGNDYINSIHLDEPEKMMPMEVIQDLSHVETGKGTSNKLDYELLLPHSVVESNSYLTLQPSQNNSEPVYDNLYELFDPTDDHLSIGNDDIDKKENFDDFLYNDSNNFNNDDDDEYFITDISNCTQNIKREKTGSKNMDVKCNICNRKCRSINALNHHMLVHSEDRPFVCEICKKAFKEQPTLRRHMWTHMDKQHQCDICEKYFVEKSSLRRHISTIHADFKPGSKPNQFNLKQQYPCDRCGKVFKSFAKYNMHQQMHGNPNYECGVCGKVYAGRSHLKIHQRIHTGEKPYVCNICNMKFAFKHVLKSHQARIHQKIHKFKCNVCLLTFVKKSDLSTHASCHMFNMKKGKRPFAGRKVMKKYNLPETKKTSVSKDAMKTGIRTTPITGLFGQLIGVLPDRVEYEDAELMDDISDSLDNRDGSGTSPGEQVKKNKECLECCKAFERMGDLKRHIISHIVENIIKKARDQNHSVPVYECEICYNTVFKQVDKFKKHLREHAKLTLYQCDVCDRAFGDSSNFSKHKKVHGISYLKCVICNRKFNTKRMMTMHMEYHKLNKPKSCMYCKKLFHFESNLRKHVKIAHLSKGTMTYRCEECGERFNSVKLKWEHQWESHGMRKVDADCHICNAQFRKVSLLRAHLVKEHTNLNTNFQY